MAQKPSSSGSEFACVNATSLRHPPPRPAGIRGPAGELWRTGRSWNVPQYLASPNRAEFRVGLDFVQRTFFLCVCCFGATVAMTAGLLLLDVYALTDDGKRPLYDDACSAATNWSCSQWLVDFTLVAVIIPVKFWRGWLPAYTVPMLVLLAVFQSANLALIGCSSPPLAPLFFQSYLCFEIALIMVWARAMRIDRSQQQAPDAADARVLDGSDSEQQPLNLAAPAGVGRGGSSVESDWNGVSFQWRDFAVVGTLSCGASSCLVYLCKTMVLPGLPFPKQFSEAVLGGAIAALLTCFTVFEARGAARYCAPGEHALAAMFICPPGVPQILGCTATRDFQEEVEQAQQAPGDGGDSSDGGDDVGSIYAPDRAGSGSDEGEAMPLRRPRPVATLRAVGQRRRELPFF